MQKNYTITIKYNDGQVKSPVAGDTTSSDTEKGRGLLSKEQAKNLGKAMVAYNFAKSYATQVVNHEVSMVELRTGSREMQERANFISQTAQQGLSIIETTLMGALVGGLPGALIGTVVGLTHTAISYVQNQERIDTARTVENQSLYLNYIRAGANGSRGGR